MVRAGLATGWSRAEAEDGETKVGCVLCAKGERNEAEPSSAREKNRSHSRPKKKKQRELEKQEQTIEKITKPNENREREKKRGNS